MPHRRSQGPRRTNYCSRKLIVMIRRIGVESPPHEAFPNYFFDKLQKPNLICERQNLVFFDIYGIRRSEHRLDSKDFSRILMISWGHLVYNLHVISMSAAFPSFL
jgi:hypothetical protein